MFATFVRRSTQHVFASAKSTFGRVKNTLGRAKASFHGAKHSSAMGHASPALRRLRQRFSSRFAKAAGGGAAGVAIYAGFGVRKKKKQGKKKQQQAKKEEGIPHDLADTGLEVPEHSLPEARPDLPTFSLDEFREHCTEENAWTHFKGAVYDISKFIHGHPGGKPRLMMAAGGDLEAYWAVYPEQHLRGHVVPWMDKRLRIGNLSSEDANKLRKEVTFDNYYKGDPVRDENLLHNTHHPFNGEPRLHMLTDSYLTPNELHYVRLHLNVPDIDEDEYVLEVSGLGVKTTRFTLDQLKTMFRKSEVVNAMQCAGNRREDFHDGPDGRQIFIGPHWVSAAFSNSKWGGAMMRDVLEHCGMDVDAIALGKAPAPGKHVQFVSYDATETGLTYGASVPIEKVVDPNGKVLCAYEMNDEELPRDHGFPVRALIPGHAGARSAKFLHKIIISDQESQKPWQIHAYRGFAPDITFEDHLWEWTQNPKVDLEKAQIVQELPVQSLCCNPPPNSVIGGTPDKITVKGVAHGWGRGIARVDVSIDDGETLTAADLYKPDWVIAQEKRHSEFAWTQFSHDFELNDEQKAKLRRGEKVQLFITSKAADRAFNVQPEHPRAYYNARGICINHMYRYPITIDPKAPEGLHIPKTAPGAYSGFGNVRTGGKFTHDWKVGPWEGEHTVKSLNDGKSS